MRFHALAAILLFAANPSFAQNWQMMADQSNLGFTVTQMGSPIDGSFNSFDTEIRFDPAALDQASVRVIIDTASVDTGYGERDDAIRGKEWFDSENHPQAVFQSSGFAEEGDGYLVTGNLTIRDIAREIEMPVQIGIDGEQAVAQGEITIDRSDFSIGTGQWTSGATIGKEVTISFDVKATIAN